MKSIDPSSNVLTCEELNEAKLPTNKILLSYQKNADEISLKCSSLDLSCIKICCDNEQECAGLLTFSTTLK